MRIRTESPSQGEGIQLTPLIDVVFLLLVFFLTATTFAEDEVELDMTLPEATAGEAGAGDELLVIQVARDGRLLVQGRELTAEGLRQRLRALAQQDARREILIEGDTEAQFGLVAQVFDACLAANLRAVSIGARPATMRPGQGGEGR